MCEVERNDRMKASALKAIEEYHLRGVGHVYRGSEITLARQIEGLIMEGARRTERLSKTFG